MVEQEQAKCQPATGRRGTENRQAILVVRDRRLVDLLARGNGQRQVGSIPGKQSGNKCWRVRHESEDNLAKTEWSEAAYILA